MAFKGKFFAKGSSKSYDLELRLLGQDLEVFKEEKTIIIESRDCKVSSIIINHPIVIECNGRFELPYSLELAEFLFQNNFLKRGFAFGLEKSVRKITMTIVGVLLVIAFFFKVILPIGSEYIARALPKSVLNKLDSMVLEQLDTYVFKDTELSDKRMKELRELFKKYNLDTYKINFRKGAKMKANAFALLDETIIITDELIDLLRKDEYILSVIFHELGHLKNKDSAEKLVSDSFISLLSFLFLGDVSGTAAVLVNIGIASQISKYSQEKEIKADVFSANLLIKEDIPVSCFTESLKLISAYYGNKESFMDFISSHPEVKDRVDNISNYGNDRPCL